ncbi:MAG: hypothetical protein P1U56_16460 [Saprospiraceae bacterium]|nr:hypothetical protein [Saprospiraceae bacterium]
MFSKQETPKELYHTYKLYDQGQEINLQDWDFRKYTVFMNTIIQFDDILSNEMIHPESKAIDKFVDRLHLKDSKVHTTLKEKFHYSQKHFISSTGNWVSEQLGVSKENLRIEKVSYSWNKSLPQFEHKSTIYGMDK